MSKPEGVIKMTATPKTEISTKTTTNERTTIMNHNTDLEKIRELAYGLLDADTRVERISADYCRPIHVSHPFFNDALFMLHDANGKCVVRNLEILDKPSDMQKAKAALREEIRVCASPLRIFTLLTPDYRLNFLAHAKDMMSSEDLSEVLSHIWSLFGYATQNDSITKEDHIRMLSVCNPQILMGNKRYYEFYQALPDEVTIYRGINDFNEQTAAVLSWTINPKYVSIPCKNIGPFGGRFKSYTGTACKAKISKSDIFAVFNDDIYECAVIVNPDKLYDIEKYSI